MNLLLELLLHVSIYRRVAIKLDKLGWEAQANAHVLSWWEQMRSIKLENGKGERDFLRQLPATYLGKNSSNSTLHVSHSKTSKTSSFARAFSSSCCCLSLPSTNTLQLYRTRIYCESFYGWRTSQGCRGRLRAIKETCCESFWVNKSRGRMLEFNQV